MELLNVHSNLFIASFFSLHYNKLPLRLFPFSYKIWQFTCASKSFQRSRSSLLSVSYIISMLKVDALAANSCWWNEWLCERHKSARGKNYRYLFNLPWLPLNFFSNYAIFVNLTFIVISNGKEIFDFVCTIHWNAYSLPIIHGQKEKGGKKLLLLLSANAWRLMYRNSKKLGKSKQSETKLNRKYRLNWSI